MAGSNGNGELTSSYESYEQRFAEFLSLCEKAKASNPSGKDVLLIDHPEAIGDNYGEIVESLNRLADAGLTLSIVPRKERD